MSDDSTSGTGAPAPQGQPQQTSAAPHGGDEQFQTLGQRLSSGPPAQSGTHDDPAWLPERLNRAQEKARSALLAELGIDDPAKAKAANAAAKKAEEDAKSLTDRITESTTRANKAESRADRLSAITTEFAARQMMGLTAEQQEAVRAIAGEDAAEQLNAITILSPTWAKQAASGAAPPVAPAKPPIPVNGTAPQHNAPDGANVSTPNHREVHASLMQKNPFAAANYGLAHLREVFPETK